MIEWLVNLIMIIVSPKASVDVIIIYLFRTYILLQSVRLVVLCLGCWVLPPQCI